MPSDCGRFYGDSLTLHAWWTFTIDQESAVLWSVGAGSALWGAIKMGATAREGLTPVRVLNPLETQTASLSAGDLCPLLKSDEAGASTCYLVETPTPTEQDAPKCLTGQPNDARHTSSSSSMIRPSAPVDDKYRAYDIIARHSKVVSWGPEGLRHLTAVKHSIHTGDAPPIRVLPEGCHSIERKRCGGRSNWWSPVMRWSVHISLVLPFCAGGEERWLGEVLRRLLSAEPGDKEKSSLFIGAGTFW